MNHHQQMDLHQDAGNDSVRVVGVPLSTFTRSICMGLKVKGVNFVLIHALPHSAIAREHHPMGRIPSFATPNNEWLFESAAIALYIDSVYTQSPVLRPLPSSPGEVLFAVEITKWISFISEYVFNTLEHGLIKPTVSLISSDHSAEQTEQLKEKIKTGEANVKAVLQILEDNFGSTKEHMRGEGPFWFGQQITWVDLFLAPIIADLKGVTSLAGLLDGCPKLAKWFDNFARQSCFLETFEGTLAHQLLQTKQSSL